MSGFRNILVATDFSESAGEAVERGRALAQAFGASLHILHVVTYPLHEPWSGYVPVDLLQETIDHMQTDARERLTQLVTPGDAAIAATAWGDAVDEILRYAETHRIDLIVMGTHGRHGWNRLVMGSVAERVVRLASCPVLTVHAPRAAAAAA